MATSTSSKVTFCLKLVKQSLLNNLAATNCLVKENLSAISAHTQSHFFCFSHECFCGIFTVLGISYFRNGPFEVCNKLVCFSHINVSTLHLVKNHFYMRYYLVDKLQSNLKLSSFTVFKIPVASRMVIVAFDVLCISSMHFFKGSKC